jgi:hypothetical protein
MISTGNIGGFYLCIASHSLWICIYKQKEPQNSSHMIITNQAFSGIVVFVLLQYKFRFHKATVQNQVSQGVMLPNFMKNDSGQLTEKEQ